jgi:hypothetical protein
LNSISRDWFELSAAKRMLRRSRIFIAIRQINASSSAGAASYKDFAPTERTVVVGMFNCLDARKRIPILLVAALSQICCDRS